MVIVSDTTPLNYLIQLELVELLHRRFGEVVIPAAVRNELTHPKAPPSVHDWVMRLPAWVDVRESPWKIEHPDLGAGESEAIALAVDIRATLVLLDDKAARDEATRRSLNYSG